MFFKKPKVLEIKKNSDFSERVLILSVPGLLTIPYILKTPCLNNVKLKEEEN